MQIFGLPKLNVLSPSSLEKIRKLGMGLLWLSGTGVGCHMVWVSESHVHCSMECLPGEQLMMDVRNAALYKYWWKWVRQSWCPQASSWTRSTMEVAPSPTSLHIGFSTCHCHKSPKVLPFSSRIIAVHRWNHFSVICPVMSVTHDRVQFEKERVGLLETRLTDSKSVGYDQTPPPSSP